MTVRRSRGWLPYWLAAIAILLQVASVPLHAAMGAAHGAESRDRIAALGVAIGQDVALCDHESGRSLPGQNHGPGHDECPICQFASHAAALACAGAVGPRPVLSGFDVIAAIPAADHVGRSNYLAARPRAPPPLA